ncbi:MAG: hypothetical protein Q4B26_21040 [Eubacteriales bacterium]|nr:hypothetical protein [Eubacteriales bacterium]
MKKKMIALLLAASTLMSGVTVFADDVDIEEVEDAGNVTTITTTVPDATYTLNIPADTEIPYGQILTQIGQLMVTDSSGFVLGKDLKVTLTYGPMVSDTAESTIPIIIYSSLYSDDFQKGFTGNNGVSSGGELIFKGRSDTMCDQTYQYEKRSGYKYNRDGIVVCISSRDWGKALPGEYSSTITFTAELVNS